jgi:hypothetical protein
VLGVSIWRLSPLHLVSTGYWAEPSGRLADHSECVSTIPRGPQRVQHVTAVVTAVYANKEGGLLNLKQCRNTYHAGTLMW